MYLIGYLSAITHKKLYGYEDEDVHPEIQKFILMCMEMTHFKNEDTLSKTLSAEYPAILRLYKETFCILKRFQNNKDFFIIL